MSKTKLRCNTCGKWFQSANAKEQTCPDCVQKARKEKLAAKNAPPTAKPAGPGAAGANFQTRPAPPPPPKPKPAPSGGNPNRWLDNISDIKVGQPDEPVRPKIPSYPAPRPDRGGPEQDRPREPHESREPREQREPGSFGNYREGQREPGGYGNYRDREGQNRERGGPPGGYRPGNYREGDRERRGPGVYHVSGSIGAPGTLGQRPRQPIESGYPRGPRPGGGGRPGPGAEKTARPKKPKAPKAAPQPRPKKEKKAPPAPFVPGEEQVKQVEARYLELAVPTEYDGIRTQISKELEIPKKAVKKIIKNLRDREEIPSWWEIQTYKGPSEELEKIREIYLPMLPLPPVGVHKQIAEQLSLKPVDVYQGIKKIRMDMNLPQYNDPALHGIELKPRHKQEAESATQEGEAATATAEAAVAGETQAAVAITTTAEGTETVETTSVTGEPGATATAEEATAPTGEVETPVTQAQVTEGAAEAAGTSSNPATPASEPTAEENKPSEAVAATPAESGNPE